MSIKDKVKQAVAALRNDTPIGEHARQVKAGNDARKAERAAVLELVEKLRAAARSKERRTDLLAVADEFGKDPDLQSRAQYIRDAAARMEGPNEPTALQAIYVIAQELESRSRGTVEDMYAGHPDAVEPQGRQSRPEGYDSGRTYNWRDVETRGYRR